MTYFPWTYCRAQSFKRSAVAAMIIGALWIGLSTNPLASKRRNEGPATFRDRIVLLAFNPSVPPADQDSILASIGAKELKRLGVGAGRHSGPGRWHEFSE